MRVPLYVRVPGVTAAATRTHALASHLDLARTVCALGGADTDDLPGQDLTPVLAEPTQPGQDALLFAQDMAWYDSCVELRYAIRGVFDGRYKYARYYGCGGGWGNTGRPPRRPKRVDVNAPFEEQDHELYDLVEDRTSCEISRWTARTAARYGTGSSTCATSKPRSSASRDTGPTGPSRRPSRRGAAGSSKPPRASGTTRPRRTCRRRRAPSCP